VNQWSSDRRVLGWQQERRPFERLREAAPVDCGERLGGKQGDVALTEQMAERLDARRRTDRCIGQDDVQAVYGELGEQALRLVVAADQMHWPRQPERRLEKQPRHQFRQNVGHAHHQAQWFAKRLPGQRVLKLPAQREDLLRIAVHDATHVGQLEPATLAYEKLLSGGVFERADLAAHRRRR
jgi:hypothetical protein